MPCAHTVPRLPAPGRPPRLRKHHLAVRCCKVSLIQAHSKRNVTGERRTRSGMGSFKKKKDSREATETFCALDGEKHGTGSPPSQRSLCLCHGLISRETTELPYPPGRSPDDSNKGRAGIWKGPLESLLLPPRETGSKQPA